MTPAQTRAHGLVIPSLSQLWLTAMLRMFAELALNVASTLRMRFHRPAVIGTRPTPDALPAEKTDTQQQETASVAASDDHDDDREIIITTQATPTESFSGPSRESRLAQHRDRQFNVPLVPTNVGTQGRTRGLFRIEAAIPYALQNRSWIPAFAGMSDERAAPKSKTPA